MNVLTVHAGGGRPYPGQGTKAEEGTDSTHRRVGGRTKRVVFFKAGREMEDRIRKTQEPSSVEAMVSG